MRVGSTEPVIYLTGQSRKVTGQTCLDMYLGRLVGPWSLVLFPGCRALGFFLLALFAALLNGVRAKNNKKTATHAWAISHARRVRPPGPPDERASYLCSLRPRQAA